MWGNYDIAPKIYNLDLFVFFFISPKEHSASAPDRTAPALICHVA